MKTSYATVILRISERILICLNKTGNYLLHSDVRCVFNCTAMKSAVKWNFKSFKTEINSFKSNRKKTNNSLTQAKKYIITCRYQVLKHITE